jgi:hypothetical protein
MRVGCCCWDQAGAGWCERRAGRFVERWGEKGSSKQCAMAWAGLGWAELGFLVFDIQTWQSAWCELDGVEWEMILYHYGYSIRCMPVPKKKKTQKGYNGVANDSFVRHSGFPITVL